MPEVINDDTVDFVNFVVSALFLNQYLGGDG